MKVYVNDEYRNEIYIRFNEDKLKGSGLMPCVNYEVLENIGLSAEKKSQIRIVAKHPK